MNGAKHLGRMATVIFGAAAMLSVGAGCGGAKTEASSARVARQTPTFESAVPEEETMAVAPQKKDRDEDKGAALTERGMCASLLEHGTLRVEDMKGGVLIVATPRDGANLNTLRRDAIHLDYSMNPLAGDLREARPVNNDDRCPLFDLAQAAERSNVVEQGNEIRIILMSDNAAKKADLRKKAQSFAEEDSDKYE